MSAYWNIPFVLLSIVIAIFGSFTALMHAERMRASSGRSAKIWMFVGAATFGLTIWCMHFTGMVAFHLPIELNYDLTLTLLSVIPALISALLGFVS